MAGRLAQRSSTMNSYPLPQIIGNACTGLATIIFLFPLQKLLSEYADKHVNHDDWTPSVLAILIPQWLLLMGALLCVTALGGFDWLKLGRTTLYGLAVMAAIALAAVSFVFIALYIRPGFTPRLLYVPVIYGVTLATVLLMALSLNQRLMPNLPLQWLRWPWAMATGLSVVVCVLVFGKQVLRLGASGAMGVLSHIGNFLPASKETLAKVAALDPEKDFTSLLWMANRHAGREVQEAATARLRSHPHFLEQLAAILETGHVEPAVSFLRDATLTPEEQERLARPARQAMERWVERVPGPNFTTKQHLKETQRWGMDLFRVLPEKFAGTGVDFGPVMADFKDKVEAKP
jgi:hypothetical protein